MIDENGGGRDGLQPPHMLCVVFVLGRLVERNIDLILLALIVDKCITSGRDGCYMMVSSLAFVFRLF
jgi:hypothetical protein